MWVLLMCSNAKKFAESRGKCQDGGQPSCGNYQTCTQTQCKKLSDSNGERCGVWKSKNMRTWRCRALTWGLNGEPVRQQDGGVISNGKTYYLHVPACNDLKDIWSQEGDARLCHDARAWNNHEKKCNAWQNVNTGELLCRSAPSSTCSLFQAVSNPTKHLCYNEEGQHFCPVLRNVVSEAYQCAPGP